MNIKRLVVSTLAALAIAAPIEAAVAREGDRGGTSVKAPGGLVRAVRQATEHYQDVNAARAAGYVSTGDCVSGPNEGAMGVHYINNTLIADGVLDVQRPEVLVYERRDGRMRLIAIEFFVNAQQWDASNPGPAVLGGQLFHYVGAPNRLRAPAYYELHVWAWKRNPNGVFSDFNPSVSCVEYEGESGNH